MFEIYSESRVSLSEYMKAPLQIRRQHMHLSKPCVEMGGSSKSSRALLGMYLGTTCEGLGMKTGYLCHACGNEKCSNPEHLYWGTSSENNYEMHSHDPELGKRRSSLIESRSPDYYSRIGGMSKENNAQRLSPDEVERRLNAIENSGVDLTKYGWVQKVANILGISHTKTRYFMDRYYEGETYKRTMRA